MRTNKEKERITVRFSIRLPKYQHIWLKNRSNSTKGTNNYESMNNIISKALREYMGLEDTKE